MKYCFKISKKNEKEHEPVNILLKRRFLKFKINSIIYFYFISGNQTRESSSSLKLRDRISHSMGIKKILVPFDGSKYSIRAFKMATEMAEKFNSKIATITVIPTFYHTRSLYANIKFEQTLLKKQKAAAKRSLTEMKSIAQKKGIEIEMDVLASNSVVKQITSYTKSKKIDLVIMGTHGRTGLSKFILGSVANGVSQAVSCNVLLVR